MGTRSAKFIPAFIVGAVLALVCMLRICQERWPAFDLFQRAEWITRDWRVKIAAQRPLLVHSNLAAVYLDEGALRLFNQSELQYSYPLPRLVYGRVVRELKAQGARVVAFDILFLDATKERLIFFYRTNLYAEKIGTLPPGPNTITSDQFFADRMVEAGNVILSVSPHVQNTNLLDFPTPLFRTNSAGLGHAISRPDSDGVLRRVPAFRVDGATGRIVWALGITMAAMELGLDLEHALVEPGLITLQSTNRSGLMRRLPVDHANNLTVDWGIRAGDRRVLPEKRYPWKHPIERSEPPGTNTSSGTSQNSADRPTPVVGTLWDVFREDIGRTTSGRAITPRYQDAIVLVGSVGSGRNVSDRGATPLHGNDFMFTAHWNIANSLLVDRFVRTVSLPVELILITAMVMAAGLLTWRLRALWSSLFVLLAAAGYTWLGVTAYVEHRQFLPLALPIGGALLMTHICMVAYRMIFEQAERRRIKSAFSKFVAPDVLELILEERQESLLGSQRELTVFFADVRNFTGFMDASHDRAEKLANQPGMAPEQAAGLRDQVARDTMLVVNEYLTVIAEVVKENNGTVDKYIGDSVMAFWGAPPPNIQHAHLAVQAAVAAQRAIQRVNAEHAAENLRRGADNERRTRTGELPLPLLPVLQVGIGVHTGTAIAGFMGSRKNLTNYTVFGRDVIIASRLENAAGPGDILISEATRAELARTDPALAAACEAIAPVHVKGITHPLAVFKVQWREPASVAPLAASP